MVGKQIEVYGSGEQRVEMSFVDDIARAIVDLMLLPARIERTYELRGDVVQVMEMAQRVRHITKTAAPIIKLKMRPGEGDSPISRAEDVAVLLGQRRRMDLTTGLSITFDWFCRRSAEYIHDARRFYGYQ